MRLRSVEAEASTLVASTAEVRHTVKVLSLTRRVKVGKESSTEIRQKGTAKSLMRMAAFALAK